MMTPIPLVSGTRQQRSTERTNIETHRQQQKSPRLKLLLLYNLTNHRPHDPHIPIQRPPHRPTHHRLPERPAEPEPHATDPRPRQPDQQHPFPPAPLRVRHPAPQHRGHELRGGETALQHARLGRDGGGGEGRVEGPELVEHVGLEGGLRQGLGEAGEGEEGELGLLGEVAPGYGRVVFGGGVGWGWGCGRDFVFVEKGGMAGYA